MFKDLKQTLKRTAPAMAAGAILLGGQLCHAQITLPDTGVDVSGHVTAAITALGAIVLVVVGGFFAFRVVMRGMSWARKV